MGLGGPNFDGLDITLDFEKVQPKEGEEKQVYHYVDAVLVKGPKLLEKLCSYPRCEESIRRAITTPGPESEEAAWNTVIPAVNQLKEFYDFSLELESCFPKLLVALCKSDPKQNIINFQALVKQVADVFDFILRFDDLKMAMPMIQDDFSYYRRTLHRRNITIRDELNRMSLFFAYPTPMMNVVNQTTVKFLSQNSSVPRDNVTTALL